MIQSATAPRPPSPSDRTTDTRRSEGAGSFQQSLAAFLDAGDRDPEPAVAATPGNDDPAADGKPLPDSAAPPLAWLAQLPPVAAPVAAPPAVADTPPPVVAAPALAVAVTRVAPKVQLESTVAPDTSDAPAETPVRDTDDMPVADALPDEVKTDAFALPAAAEPAPRGAAPAAEVFGAAIRAAVGKDDDAAPRRQSADTGALPVGAVGLEPQRHAIAATGDVQQAPLDTRRGDFPNQMIDRIEQLRDDANANDTRIRLVPDALGQIDVTMRREGDAVHVHFAAEQAATRSLLEDARPQLADIAAARGIALGQTSVGADGGNQQRQPAPAPIPTWHPPHITAAAAAATPSDIRIA